MMAPFLIASQVALAAFSLILGRQRQAMRRWSRLLPVSSCHAASKPPWWVRLPFPLGCAQINAKLVQANLALVNEEQWMKRRTSRALLCLAVTWPLLTMLVGREGGLFHLACALVAFVSPDVQLELTLRARSRHIQKAFPGFLDRLATCTGAGHSLYASFKILAPRMQGPLGDSLRHVLFKVETGQRFWTAWDYLCDTVNLPEVWAFRSAVLEAEVLGTPVADTLSNMAVLARAERRNRLQAKVDALPLKLSICTIFFFLPPILVLLVLPNLLSFFGVHW